MRIADLHIHSRYSRATSRDCVPDALDFWARRKGIDLVGTGDFTHPAWRAELAEALVPAEEGLYTLRPDLVRPDGCRPAGEAPRFVVTGEISSIYKKGGRVRKVHSLILLPSLEAAEVLSRRLEAIGNIRSDGRPILGLDCRDLLEITLEAAPDAVFIPAHIWTPHFSLFGAFSGFDTMEECFGDLTKHIHALETGLSSDPPMNWRLSALDGYQLVSHSDAHSPQKLGREADLLDVPLTYPDLARALTTGEGLTGTVEFFPEEGKYHYDGHRNCHQCLSPAQAEGLGGICPVCAKKLTTGVLHRVEQLADRPEGYQKPDAPVFERLAPLPEVIAASLGGKPEHKDNQRRYEDLLRQLGSEFHILRDVPEADIAAVAGPCVAEGVRRLRAGRVEWQPGYDGAYGAMTLLTPSEREALTGQASLFGVEPVPVKKKRSAARRTAPRETPAAVPTQEFRPNEDQQRAMDSASRVVAVIAGPGSGKTGTLAGRVEALIRSGRSKAGEITAVTFTNRAAGELRERLEARLGKRKAGEVTIGTFHAVCLTLLEEAGERSRLGGTYECLELAGRTIRALGVKCSPADLLEGVSRRKNGLPAGEEPEGMEGACAFYIRQLHEAGLMDFDDLLLQALALAEAMRGPAQRRFRHLLVDEFQDCNDLQYRLVRAWSRGGASLFVIGDPDQSIYGFRGAENCFDKLRADFPGMEEILLRENYRSTPEILSAALAVIAHNGGTPRQLAATRPSGPAVRLLTAESERDEGIFIAKEIMDMVGGGDMLSAQRAGTRERVRGFSDIAVCCRTRRQGRHIEQCLRREDIPCLVVGKDDALSDPIVRGVLCFFRLLLEPEDTLALEGCLSLVWECPADLIRPVSDTWSRAGGEVLRRVQAVADSYAQVGKLRRWLELSHRFAPRVEREKPWKLLEEWGQSAGCAGSEKLEELHNMAVFYRDMPSFLLGLTLGGEGDLRRRAGHDYASGAVTLLTLHAAKGLEFPVVFLAGLRQGLLPLESDRRPADRAEERRLFYVGMTRAKEELLLLTSGEPSPFLAELPEGIARQAARPPRRKAPQSGQMSLF
ncbi:UvrD-helicase domain-containing protein [Pseudoflavonifractor phocaeensis]|uniref:UvrD-helicase domain-containing protein n=1 Tax=Pseudoflavonifractor phocaeensis TaxID=1870988 RepID=UPI0030840F1B